MVNQVLAEVPTSDPDLFGFTYVKKKKKKKNRTLNLSRDKKGESSGVSTPLYAPEETTLAQVQERYLQRSTLLHKSQFLRDFRVSFGALLESTGSTFPRPTALKMLGIGTLTHNPSLTQLSFGLALASMLEIPLAQVSTSDPMYTATDEAFLTTTLGLKVQTVQEGNGHHDAGEVTTMVFAPHVPKSVYEATLRAYWSVSAMGHLVLLGNNLRHYPDIYSDEKLGRESPAILSLAQGEILQVVALPDNFEHNNVFNDLAIQWVNHESSLPEIRFEGHEIEKERFEINQDKVRGEPNDTKREARTSKEELPGRGESA